jgi:hypothetical protein
VIRGQQRGKSVIREIRKTPKNVSSEEKPMLSFCHLFPFLVVYIPTSTLAAHSILGYERSKGRT